ncbi:protein kinase domain-containing protein [Nonomuraea wenchangensis]|uniref:protein kinase domain-containing protein n=1 Tax=Nonomuraea wenchangensis TaxID=568860 RepID=UPI003790ACBD
MGLLLPGDPRQLGDYWLVRRLGAGGQGVVYEGYDRAGRRVAIKALREEYLDQGDMRSRFAKEVVAARRAASFCTARVLEADLDALPPYIVSEYVDGPNLRRAVETGGPLDDDSLHRLAVGMATALTSIHRAGIVHRDLKPDNVLLGPDGPRLIDFGIAHADGMTLTNEGRAAAGTPAYMAPERLAGQRGGTGVDVWAWGAVLLYAASGRSPFAADSGGDVTLVRYRVLNHRPDFSVVPLPGLRELVEAAMSLYADTRPDAATLLLRLVGGWAPKRLLPEALLTPDGLAKPEVLTHPDLLTHPELLAHPEPPRRQDGDASLPQEFMPQPLGPPPPTPPAAGSTLGPVARDPEAVPDRPDDTDRLLRQGSRAAAGLLRPAAAVEPSPAELAEQVYSELGPEDREVVPRVLLRLVLPGDGADGALRTAYVHELSDPTTDPQAVARVLDGFAGEGLLVRRDDAVTLAAAGLLRAWPRLRGWIEADRPGLAVHGPLGAAARLWDDHGREPDDLYRGPALRDALAWAESGGGLLRPNSLEHAFLEESAAHTRARVRRRRRTAGVMAALVALVLAATAVAVAQDRAGSRQRDEAAALRIAQLAASSRYDDPATAMLLSVAAWRVAAVPQAVAALHSSLAQRELRTFTPPVRVSGGARYALSADGRTLALADGDTATLWHLPVASPAPASSGVTPGSPGGAAATVRGIGGPAHALALSDDGALLASADARSIRTWDVATARWLGEIAGGAEWLGFGPGGRLLAAVTPEGRARAWELTPGGGRPLPLDVPEALGVAFAPDGRHLAVPVSRGRYELWDRERRLATAPGRAVALSQTTLAVAGDTTIHLTTLPPSALAGPAAPARRDAASAAGPVWGGRLPVRARVLVFSGDGRRLATYDGAALALWAPGRDDPLLVWPLPQPPAELVFGPGDRTLVALNPGGRAVVLDVAAPPPLVPSAGAATFAPGATAVAIWRAGAAELWDVAARRRIARLVPAAGGSPVALAFGPDGRTLAVGTSYPATVTLWDTADPAGPRSRAVPIAGADEVEGLVFAPDGRTLVVSPQSAARGRARAEERDVATGRRTAVLAHTGGSRMAFRPDSGALAVNGRDNALLDLRTGRAAEAPFAAADGVRAIAYSPDGKVLATGATTEGVTLWDGAGPPRRLPVGAEEGEQIDALAFSPDGRTLAAAGAYGKVWLWDLAHGVSLGLPVPRHEGAVLALAVSRDGRALHSVGADGRLAVHPLDPGVLVREVCARAGGTLSPAAWRRLIPWTPYRKVC